MGRHRQQENKFSRGNNQTGAGKSADGELHASLRRNQQASFMA
jgi:hypothetical protein